MSVKIDTIYYRLENIQGYLDELHSACRIYKTTGHLSDEEYADQHGYLNGRATLEDVRERYRSFEDCLEANGLTWKLPTIEELLSDIEDSDYYTSTVICS